MVLTTAFSSIHARCPRKTVRCLFMPWTIMGGSINRCFDPSVCPQHWEPQRNEISLSHRAVITDLHYALCPRQCQSTTATTACGSYETAKDTNFSCKNRPTSALEVFLNDMRLLTYHTRIIYTTLFHHRTSLSVKIWFLANSVCCDGVDVDLILYSVSVCLSVCLHA